MGIVLIVIGILCFVYGVLNILGLTKIDTSEDSELGKILMSERSRYFFGRYYVGAQLLVGGLAAVVLGWICTSSRDFVGDYARQP